MNPETLVRILTKIRSRNEQAYRGLIAIVRSLAEALGV